MIIKILLQYFVFYFIIQNFILVKRAAKNFHFNKIFFILFLIQFFNKIILILLLIFIILHKLFELIIILIRFIRLIWLINLIINIFIRIFIEKIIILYLALRIFSNILFILINCILPIFIIWVHFIKTILWIIRKELVI